MRKFLLLLLILTQHFGFTQNDTVPDSALSVKKSVVEIPDTSKKDKVKKPLNPMKASLLAAVLPGAGQIYNRKYWKAPIVWGGGITLYLMYDHYNRRHHFWHQILIYKDRGGAPEFIEPYVEQNGSEFTDVPPSIVANYTQSNTQLKNDAARKRKQQIIIWSSLFYVLQIVDATVDAHFSTFDVSEELTLNIAPAIFETAPWAQGIKLSLRF